MISPYVGPDLSVAVMEIILHIPPAPAIVSGRLPATAFMSIWPATFHSVRFSHSL